MSRSVKHFNLLKNLFTEDDFEEMTWHDNLIYGISFDKNFKLSFDIDYIFKWIQRGKRYKFWVSPCTLVFENVYDIIFDLELSTTELNIDFIERTTPKRPRNFKYITQKLEYEWYIETQQGTISFKSVGYKQFVRKKPILIGSQYIETDKRDEISFDEKMIDL